MASYLYSIGVAVVGAILLGVGIFLYINNNKKESPSKTIKYLSIALLVIGGLMLLGGIILGLMTKSKKDSLKNPSPSK